MSIRTIILAGVLALLVTLGIGGGVGTTSEWRIVVSPCAWCGATNDIEVHHIIPQHVRPDLAHDTNNMVVLCRIDHFRLGHRGCWTNAVTNLVQMLREGRK